MNWAADRSRARRVTPSEHDEPPPDYTDAVEVTVPGAAGRSPQEWARAVFEQAPPPLRWSLAAGWSTALGLRLGPAHSADHVLGWRAVTLDPTAVRLRTASRLMRAQLVLRVLSDGPDGTAHDGSGGAGAPGGSSDASAAGGYGTVRLTTSLWFQNPAAGPVWSAVGPVHREVTPYLLGAAAERWATGTEPAGTAKEGDTAGSGAAARLTAAASTVRARVQAAVQGAVEGGVQGGVQGKVRAAGDAATGAIGRLRAAAGSDRTLAARRRATTWVQRRLANPVNLRLTPYIPGQAILETVGRSSGLPRQTPIGGRLDGATFWLVSEFGRHAQYVRNLEADPAVRVRVGDRWYRGTASVVEDDDPLRRLRDLPRLNSLVVRLLGTDLLSIRVDLEAP